ncbi:MAG: recombinase family protein [Rhodoplanes sp.]
MLPSTSTPPAAYPRWGTQGSRRRPQGADRTTYIGRHRFNTKFWKTRERKPDAEVVEISVPPIVAASDFEAVQDLLKIRGPALTALRVVSSPTLPTGIPSAKQAYADRVGRRPVGELDLIK